ncbi:MAG: hypothetical protein PHU46_08585 [Rhodocyclaceae bacterium]|nr:hypothetical protein [Rhodocyclaceae bacterium]
MSQQDKLSNRRGAEAQRKNSHSRGLGIALRHFGLYATANNSMFYMLFSAPLRLCGSTGFSR